MSVCVSHPIYCEREKVGGGKEARRCFSSAIGCSFSMRLFLTCGIDLLFELIAHTFIIVFEGINLESYCNCFITQALLKEIN